MTWEKLAFFHWRASSVSIARRLPPGLELDTFDGDAWIGVVPFIMRGVGIGSLPAPFGTREFLELNVRTYVVHEGVPSVWFFSLDASHPLAVRAARALYHLPYFDASLSWSQDERVRYEGRRVHKNAPPGVWSAQYWPVGPVFRSEPGSFAHWSTERYRLVTTDNRGRLLFGEVSHEPWPLQVAEGEITENSLAEGWGVSLEGSAESVLYAERLPVRAGPPRRA